MFSFLESVTKSFRNTSKSRPAAPRTRLSLMRLEDRQVPSASPLTAQLAIQVAPAQPTNLSYVASNVNKINVSTITVKQVADFHGASFTMMGENGTMHSLTIQTQTNNPYGSAVITGMWDSINGTGSAFTGVLTVDGANTDLSITWGNHRLDAVISGSPAMYHIDGTVYVNGVKGGPGHVVGNEAPAIPKIANTSYQMTSVSNGTHHTLTIGATTDLFNGTASFTGMWDGGSVVTGTAHYEPNGHISITFTWGGNHQFAGTITPNLYTYGSSIAGLVTVNGNPNTGPGYVSGTQTMVFMQASIFTSARLASML